jgi:hypothetical protein
VVAYRPRHARKAGADAGAGARRLLPRRRLPHRGLAGGARARAHLPPRDADGRLCAALETADGPLHAIAFLINRGHSRYAGRLPENKIIAAIAEARGPLGACATYLLFNTVAHLEELGIGDRHLKRLRDRVAARIAGAADLTGCP